jgi:hypothetical protein
MVNRLRGDDKLHGNDNLARVRYQADIPSAPLVDSIQSRHHPHFWGE